MDKVLTQLLTRFYNPPTELLSSKLFDETTFYKAFVKDINACSEEIIIESPFITTRRMDMLMPALQEALIKQVQITVLTRNPNNLDDELREQAERELNFFDRVGIKTVLCDGNHHRKLAILDKRIMYEGSLNILSQNYSKEIMRRIESEKLAKQMIQFLKLEK